MNYLYLATPYSRYDNGLNQAAKIAAEIAGVYTRRGTPVYSPIAETHAICRATPGLDPLDHEMWMRRDAPFVYNASGLIVAKMRGWDKSTGVLAEIKMFEDAGKPVTYVYPADLGVIEREIGWVAGAYILQKDVDRIVDHINMHIDHPQKDPMRGNIGWRYIRLMKHLLEWAIETGLLVVGGSFDRVFAIEKPVFDNIKVVKSYPEPKVDQM